MLWCESNVCSEMNGIGNNCRRRPFAPGRRCHNKADATALGGSRKRQGESASHGPGKSHNAAATTSIRGSDDFPCRAGGRLFVKTRRRRRPLQAIGPGCCRNGATAPVAGSAGGRMPAGQSLAPAIRGGVSRCWCLGLRRYRPVAGSAVGPGPRDCALPAHAGNPQRTGSA